MYSKVLVVFAVAALAAANDILEGTNNTTLHKPFFEGHYEAQWAVTRATKDIAVNTTGVISAINVTDLRPAKDGEATIISGGIGLNNVIISLKSPAVFRGYDFLVEVYVDEDIERGSHDVEPSTPEVTVTPAAESKPTDKSVTGTGKPSTGMPTDKLDVLTSTTGKPYGPTVTIPTGKPEVTGLPTEPTRVPKVEMEIPEEAEDTPMKTKITFDPTRTQF